MMSNITMFNILEFSGSVDQLARSCVGNCQILLASFRLGDQGFWQYCSVVKSVSTDFLRLAVGSMRPCSSINLGGVNLLMFC